VNAYRFIWRALCGVLVTAGVVLGVVVLPVEVWVVVALLVIVLGLTAVVGRTPADEQVAQVRPSVVQALLWAVVVCLVVVAVFGLAGVLHGGVVYVLLLVVASSPPAVGWWGGLLRTQVPQASPSPDPPSGAVSTSQLCREWHESYLALSQATTSTARLRIVMARQRCLDELERRDPDGLHAWLASTASAGGDPSRFLTDSRSDTPPDQQLT
jgi:hypothetical protein